MTLVDIWLSCVLFNWFILAKTTYEIKSELNLRTGTVFVLYGLIFSFIFGPVWSFMIFFHLIWIKNAK
jgi:hypothetical protein